MGNPRRPVVHKHKLVAGLGCHSSEAVSHLVHRLLLRKRREAWVGHYDERGPQRARGPKEELQEANLARVPYELAEAHRVDARRAVFDGARLLPEAAGEVVTSSRLIASFTL